jgi:hypothetical protein
VNMPQINYAQNLMTGSSRCSQAHTHSTSQLKDGSRFVQLPQHQLIQGK